MDVVQYLTTRYKDNVYMSKKLQQYIDNLPQTMQHIEDEHLKRLRQKHDMNERRENFIHWFLGSYKFYYYAPTEQFVKYSKHTFTVVSEDELTQLITRTIHLEINVFRCKQQIKRRLLRSIRFNPLFNAVPSENTIQSIVRDMSPHFDYNRVKTEYFLTCIGDILSGKRSLFYFMDPTFKPFVHAIAHGLYTTVNKHFSDYFKYKYYDHDYKKCRIIPGVYSEYQIARINYLNLAVVSVYYSNRFGSSDVYLSQCGNQEFENHVLVLYNHTPTTLFESFIADYTVEGGTMPYKTLYFFWKFFLCKMTLPFVLSQNTFKHMVVNAGKYDAEHDLCLMGCRYLPQFINLEMFWLTFMVQDNSSSYDVSELVDVYNEWCDPKGFQVTSEEFSAWLEKSRLEKSLLETSRLETSHFLPASIVGYKCKLWDKSVDIENSIEACSDPSVDAYEFYRTYAASQNKRVVSQAFFSDYMKAR
jgi:hypothetical protein